MPDVIVVGGGITGTAAAYEIARTGHSVTLLERQRLASMASGWTLGGVRQSGRDLAELPLARAAAERWSTLDDELDSRTGYRRHGNLRLARTPGEVEIIRTLVAEQRALGLDLAFLPDLASVRSVAPAIGPAILAASFCPTDGHADPTASVAAFAAAAQRYGADIREGVAVRHLIRTGSRVIGVETIGGEQLSAERVVLAAGIHAPELLAPLGIDLPISVKIVCVLQSVPVEPIFDQVFGVANADAAGRQEIGGCFRVTTGIGDWAHQPSDWTDSNIQPSADDVARLIRLATQVLPILRSTGVARIWGGLIDLTPDALPVIDHQAGPDGLVVAAGFSGHGFGIGPVTGEILRDLCLGRSSPFDLTPFQLGRFAVPQHNSGALSLHG